MPRTYRAVRFVPAALLLCAFVVVPIAAQSTSNWQNLASLVPGQRVKVEIWHGPAQQAAFLRTFGDQLYLGDLAKPIMLPRAAIRRISVKSRSRRTPHVLIGAAAGVGSALLYCATTGNSILGCRDTTPKAKGWLVSLGFFGGVGALVGSLWSTHRWREVYQAPEAPAGARLAR